MLVTPTSKCLANSGMLKLSMETSAAIWKAPLRISSTEIEPRSRRRRGCVITSPHGVECHRNRGRRPERLTRDVRIVVDDEPDIGQPVQQALQCDAGLHAGQVQSHAGVLARRKRQVRQAFPEDVELL